MTSIQEEFNKIKQLSSKKIQLFQIDTKYKVTSNIHTCQRSPIHPGKAPLIPTAAWTATRKKKLSHCAKKKKKKKKKEIYYI
jgi:hypothetical protein